MVTLNFGRSPFVYNINQNYADDWKRWQGSSTKRKSFFDKDKPDRKEAVDEDK